MHPQTQICGRCSCRKHFAASTPCNWSLWRLRTHPLQYRQVRCNLDNNNNLVLLDSLRHRSAVRKHKTVSLTLTVALGPKHCCLRTSRYCLRGLSSCEVRGTCCCCSSSLCFKSLCFDGLVNATDPMSSLNQVSWFGCAFSLSLGA